MMKRHTTAILAGIVLAGTVHAQEKANLKTSEEKVSYTIGQNIGQNFKQQGIPVNFDAFLKCVKDAVAGTPSPLSETEVREVMTAFQKEMQTKTEKKGEENKKTGEAFLAENKKKPGVITLPSGLQYKVV